MPSLPASALAILLALTSAAQADCYADYKAKQDNPLRLHYGVMQVPDSSCSRAAAAGVVRARLADAGWTLLTVLSTFGAEGLQSRKVSAGANFLRY